MAVAVAVTAEEGDRHADSHRGGGATGLYTAIALARRGHQVTVIDRDRGPDGGRWWDRKGVMQFHHPHFFRQQVADALLAEMPQVWHGLLAAGAEPAVLPGQPGVPAGLHCRRLTFERVLRSAAVAEPGVRLRTGRVALDGLIYAGDAACTTNPAAGRGVTTSLRQAQQLIGLLGEHGRDFTSCSLAFDHWCADNIKPWFDDHVYWDTDLIRRWSGQDVDLARPLPSDLIVAAVQADPS